MTELLAADVVVRERPPAAATPPSLPTALPGFVGITERGPLGKRLVSSWDEFKRVYGGYVAAGDVAAAMRGYFDNGGRNAYISRVVHYIGSAPQSAAASATIATAGAATQGEVTSGNAEPFALDPGDTLDVNVDGGGTEQAVFDAAAAARTGVAGSFPTGFTGGETLQLKFDGGVVQTVTFTSAAQTLADVIDEINPAIVGGFADDNGGELRITSDRKGTGSIVEIVGGTAAATLGHSTGSTIGSGDVSNIAAVTAAEAKTVIEADTSALVDIEVGGEITIKTPTIGAGGSIQVEATSTADDVAKFNFDNAVHAGTAAGPGNTGTFDASSHGSWGDGLVARISDATDGDADHFNWSTLLDGVVEEFFANLSTDPTDPRYWQTIINDAQTGSELGVLTDLLAGTPPTNRPTNGDYALTGGSDGLTGLSDTDFIGDESIGNGIRAFDAVEDLTLLCIPGRATAAVHAAMVTYCETTRKRQVFAILDPPSGQTATAMRDYVRTTAALYELSESAAIYWPRVKVVNPDATVFTSDADGNVVVPPSGHVAGVYARTDQLPGGVHQAPAGPERGILYNVTGFETDETLQKAKRDIVYPSNINPLTTFGGLPRHIDGNRCLKTSGSWGTVGERRGVSYIERLIKLALAFTRHSNNTPALRRRASRTVELILLAELTVGAFASDDPAKAFFVDFSKDLNPPSVVRQKKLIGHVGIAKAKPTDYTIIDVSEDTRALDEELAGLGG